MVLGDLQAFVAANPYDVVIAHLGAEADVVHDALPEAVLTAEGKPTGEASLRRLTMALDDATEGLPRAARGTRFAEEMTNVARFQFGDAGKALVEGATYRGRFPDVHALRGGAQVAMYTGRGLLSLTLEGGRLLSRHDAYCVEIEDFLPKGNVFAVGVTGATQDIRVGDDVAVRHAGDVRAVGTARMTGREMTDAERGEAVRVRHATPAAPNP